MINRYARLTVKAEWTEGYKVSAVTEDLAFVGNIEIPDEFWVHILRDVTSEFTEISLKAWSRLGGEHPSIPRTLYLALYGEKLILVDSETIDYVSTT